MWKWVGLQWLVGILLVLALLLVSVDHARSALWGLLCMAMPSTLFAARLALGARTAAGGAALLFAGEFLKVAASVALMALVVRFDTALVWWAFILAAVLVLKSYFVAFFLRKPCQQPNTRSPRQNT